MMLLQNQNVIDKMYFNTPVPTRLDAIADSAGSYIHSCVANTDTVCARLDIILGEMLNVAQYTDPKPLTYLSMHISVIGALIALVGIFIAIIAAIYTMKAAKYSEETATNSEETAKNVERIAIETQMSLFEDIVRHLYRNKVCTHAMIAKMQDNENEYPSDEHFLKLAMLPEDIHLESYNKDPKTYSEMHEISALLRNYNIEIEVIQKQISNPDTSAKVRESGQGTLIFKPYFLISKIVDVMDKIKGEDKKHQKERAVELILREHFDKLAAKIGDADNIILAESVEGSKFVSDDNSMNEHKEWLEEEEQKRKEQLEDRIAKRTKEIKDEIKQEEIKLKEKEEALKTANKEKTKEEIEKIEQEIKEIKERIDKVNAAMSMDEHKEWLESIEELEKKQLIEKIETKTKKIKAGIEEEKEKLETKEKELENANEEKIREKIEKIEQQIKRIKKRIDEGNTKIDLNKSKIRLKGTKKREKKQLEKSIEEIKAEIKEEKIKLKAKEKELKCVNNENAKEKIKEIEKIEQEIKEIKERIDKENAKIGMNEYKKWLESREPLEREQLEERIEKRTQEIKAGIETEEIELKAKEKELENADNEKTRKKIEQEIKKIKERIDKGNAKMSMNKYKEWLESREELEREQLEERTEKRIQEIKVGIEKEEIKLEEKEEALKEEEIKLEEKQEELKTANEEKTKEQINKIKQEIEEINKKIDKIKREIKKINKKIDKEKNKMSMNDRYEKIKEGIIADGDNKRSLLMLTKIVTGGELERENDEEIKENTEISAQESTVLKIMSENVFDDDLRKKLIEKKNSGLKTHIYNEIYLEDYTDLYLDEYKKDEGYENYESYKEVYETLHLQTNKIGRIQGADEFDLFNAEWDAFDMLHKALIKDVTIEYDVIRMIPYPEKENKKASEEVKTEA